MSCIPCVIWLARLHRSQAATVSLPVIPDEHAAIPPPPRNFQRIRREDAVLGDDAGSLHLTHGHESLGFTGFGVGFFVNSSAFYFWLHTLFFAGGANSAAALANSPLSWQRVQKCRFAI
jgi:hypothetical protein